MISRRLVMVTGRKVISAGLRIAGIPILVRSVFPFEAPVFPREYASFTSGTGSGSGEAVRVDLVAGNPADAADGEMVADTGPGCLYRRNETRVILWSGPDKSQPFWAASFDAGLRNIKVWCGEKCLARRTDGLRIRNPFRYPLDQLLLMFVLARRGQCIVHAAGLVSGTRCVVAAGRSGAGKSTLSRLWAERHGQDSLLSDDRLILGPGVVHGTPWPGELGAAANECRIPSAVVILEKAAGSELVPIPPREAVERLIPVTSVLWFEPEYLTQALAGMEKAMSEVPAYVFRFTPDHRAVTELGKVFPV